MYICFELKVSGVPISLNGERIQGGHSHVLKAKHVLFGKKKVREESLSTERGKCGEYKILACC